MIEVTKKAHRALEKVFEEKPQGELRIYVKGFG